MQVTTIVTTMTNSVINKSMVVTLTTHNVVKRLGPLQYLLRRRTAKKAKVYQATEILVEALKDFSG